MSDKDSKDRRSNRPDPTPADPHYAEAQLYQRIEAARARIYGLINQITRESGLPTAIIVELLRGVIAETTLTLERTAHGQTLVELMELRAAEEAKIKEEAAKKAAGSGGGKASDKL